MTGAAPSDDIETARAERDDKIDEAKAILAEIEPPEDGDPPASSGSRRRWWHRHLESEERQRILAELGIKRQPHWAFRFYTMMALSVIVAAMGLSADSAAVVIGAMLLAPLMQPVLAAAACISMALFRKALQSLGIVLVATIGAIVISYVLSALFIPGDLPNEVTSRTQPDIRDLIVALGAGTAGAYATVRKDVSSSLPGVAVAVALVPPLGAAGITLEAGRGTLAQGALLLYATNLAAILLAASIVFVATGFVPPKRLAMKFRTTALVAAMVALVLVAITIPLLRASQSIIEETNREIEASEIVADWLGPLQPTEPPTIEFQGQRILVRVRSLDVSPDEGDLIETMQSRFGADKIISTEWDRVSRATTTTTIAPTTTQPSEAEVLTSRVRTVVDEWLQDGEFTGIRRVDALEIVDGVVQLDASGIGDAPSLTDLTERLDAALDVQLRVNLGWVERRSVTAAEPEPTPTEVLTSRITALANEWASDNGVEIISVEFDGVSADIEAAGPVAPDAGPLVRDVRSILSDGNEVT
ncbi:MAG: TIGR00341 family protein, partial [Ilumatobacter sp.]